MSATGHVSAVERVRAAHARAAAVDRPEVWIDLRPEGDVLAEAAAVDARAAAGDVLPLAGLTVAVKGNIDVAGLPTTAACPAFARTPPGDAAAVARLRAAGALVLGTTNLDQFATGLVGTRSPYGAVRHATSPDRVSGGSSSGSAVAVALGIADVALGTDTAGSGRVPAAFHGLVGLKPTRGLVPTTGVVPACRSLDCVSVLAPGIDLAERVLAVLAGPDPGDPLSRPRPLPAPRPSDGSAGDRWVVGVPQEGQLGVLAPGWADAFAAAGDTLAAAGAQVVPVDVGALLEAAQLLYGGAFVAERYAAVGAFVDAHPGEVDPVVAAIVTGARDVPAWALHRDAARLEVLRAHADPVLAGVDALLLPTTVRHPTLAEVAADPVGVNSELGRFTNAVNLLDLAALAVPAGTVDGLPFGVQLIGVAGSDAGLGVLGRAVTGQVAALPARAEPLPATHRVVVVGAHLRGEPLNGELTRRGATLEGATRTAPAYRLHALATTPPKPGLRRVEEGGAAVEVEVWRLPAAGFADLVATLPPPMAVGPVELAGGERVPGFLAEPVALAGAADITAHGGWRGYLTSR